MTLRAPRENKTLFLYPAPRRSFRLPEVEFWLALLGVDLLLLVLSLAAGVGLRAFLGDFFPSWPRFEAAEHWNRFMTHPWLFLPIPLVFLWQGLFRRLPFWEELRRLWLGLGEGFALIFALITLAKLGEEFSRLSIFLAAVSAFLFFPLGRLGLKRFLFSFRRYRIPALIYPANEEGERLLSALLREPTLGYEVIGFVDDEPSRFGRKIYGLKVFGPLRQIGKLARLKGVDTVFVVVNGQPFPWLRQFYAYLQRNVREIFFVPNFAELGLFNAEISFLFAGKTAFIRISNPLGSRLNQLLKRSFDLLGAIFFGLLSLPLMLFIALAVKLDSPGPVFFSQERVGFRGRRFRILKFRTMHVEAERRLAEFLARDPLRRKQWLEYRKLERDPRVTRVGRFLRRFSLDELPQFWNILRGEMSLVGPRPVTREELDTYYGEQAHFYTAVRPGLTGLWQVSGRNRLTYQERVYLDVWYVQNWSLWLDLIILLRTLPVVLKCEGVRE